ncbi:MAG: electron transport complex subunit RsxG [Gammaproteobacteria bacterium]|nr:electron transport complex subunit RsxG [Gammaproteobacteria bacterium]
MIISAAILGLFAVLGTGMVSYTYQVTKPQIKENERQAILKNLHAIISPEEHDNPIESDTIEVIDPMLGSDKPVKIYRARMGKLPVAAIINSIAPDGYGGNIYLLVAIRYDGVLAGVRVVGHRETPGLGDGIEAERTDWVLGFNDRSLSNPTEQGWGVKKDGGVFDQFTGATITPRVVVKAVYKTLTYYSPNREALFAHVEKPLPEIEVEMNHE